MRQWLLGSSGLFVSLAVVAGGPSRTEGIYLDEIRTWMGCVAGQTQSRRLAAEAMFSVG